MGTIVIVVRIQVSIKNLLKYAFYLEIIGKKLKDIFKQEQVIKLISHTQKFLIKLKKKYKINQLNNNNEKDIFMKFLI